MEKYVSKILINNSWRDVLIYKSSNQLTFDDLGTHKLVQEIGNEALITTYRTEPYIYKTVSPSETDGNYYYWFIVNTIEKDIVATNSEELQKELTGLKNKYANLESITLDNSELLIDLQIQNDLDKTGGIK